MPAKILIIEDHADSREMLQTLLSDQGYTVLVAEDGLAALKLLETERPDFIITDLQMPNLDGVSFVKRLREHSQWGHIPVLVLSALGSGDLSEAMIAGADGAMRKPLQFNSLTTLIKNLLTASLCLFFLIHEINGCDYTL
jgi:CheY-like chemotaxis protein